MNLRRDDRERTYGLGWRGGSKLGCGSETLTEFLAARGRFWGEIFDRGHGESDGGQGQLGVGRTDAPRTAPLPTNPLLSPPSRVPIRSVTPLPDARWASWGRVTASASATGHRARFVSDQCKPRPAAVVERQERAGDNNTQH